ncbi:MAG TPA: TetR/AcrR family transcriptional regulator [Rhodocyclaceae bacterium]|nr:TetR/AcrR family transcriptional regulator [Rhodocyclaceae bacterium]
MARGKAPTFEAQRGAIMAAAAALIAKKGFHSASMAEIAKACGVSKPLLYHYYRDKEHILFDIADSYIDQLLSVVERVAAQRLEPEAHLLALVSGFMAEYEHSENHHRVLVQDVRFLQEEQAGLVIERQRRVVAGVTEVLVRIEPALVRLKLERPVTMILFGMINWTYTWLRAEGPLTYADMGPLVTRILLKGMGGLVEPPGETNRSAATAKA